MPESIKILEGTDIIQITSYGKVTRRDLKKSSEEVYSICRDKGITKILVDASRITERMPAIVAVEHGSYLAKNEIFRHAKHAFVIAENIYNNICVICICAFKRGVNIKSFVSKTDAIKWLNT